jgi:hypothetical protein
MPLAAAATAATARLDQESVLSLDLKDEDDDVLNDLAETCASLDTYVGKLMETSVEFETSLLLRRGKRRVTMIKGR